MSDNRDMALPLEPRPFLPSFEMFSASVFLVVDKNFQIVCSHFDSKEILPLITKILGLTWEQCQTRGYRLGRFSRGTPSFVEIDGNALSVELERVQDTVSSDTEPV